MSRWAALVATLRQRDFRGWFASQVFAASGTATQGIGQSWLVLQITHSGLALSGITVMIFGPVLLGGAAAGALLDRVDRRHVLLATQAAFAVISTGLAIATATGTGGLWLLYLAALLTGSVNALDGPARQVYIVDLVGARRAGAAVGLYEVVFNASRVLGPAAGGVFLAVWGPVPCFIFNGVSYLPGLLVLRGHLRRRAPAVRAGSRSTRTRGAVRLGLRYAWRHPQIRAMLLVAVASGMLFNLGVTGPLLATRTFHLGGGGYGEMNAMFGVGALAGALMAAYQAADPTGSMVRALSAATGVAVLLTACAPTVPVLMVGMAVTGFVSIWLIALANTLTQLRSDPALRGRVMGVWTMALPGMNPLTALASGALGDTAGPREAFGLAGACLLAVTAISWPALSERGARAGAVDLGGRGSN